MSILDDKTRIEGAKSGIKDWLISKNISVPDGARLDDMAELLSTVGSGNPVAFGTFTPSSDISEITLTHGLGAVPDFICVQCLGDWETICKIHGNTFNAVGLKNELVPEGVNESQYWGVTVSNMWDGYVNGARSRSNALDITAIDGNCFNSANDTTIAAKFAFKASLTFFWVAIGGLSQ